MAKRIAFLATVALAALAPTWAVASQITSILDPALTGSTVIDFDGEPTHNFLAKTLSGVTFTAATGGYMLRIADAGEGGTYGGTLQELSTLNSNVGFSIDFATSVSAFGMNWGGANLNWTVSLYDSTAALIETLTFLGGDPGKGATYIEFYGAKAIDIKSVVFVAEGADHVKIDGFQFVPGGPAVPEPATLLLVGLGVGAVGARARRRARRILIS